MDKQLTIGLMAAAKVFEQHQWVWAGGEGFYVPDVEAVAHLVDHLRDAIQNDPFCGDDDERHIETGRLVLSTYDGGRTIEVCLRLGTIETSRAA